MASGIEDTDLLERIHSGLISREAFEEEVVNQVYSGLKRYCRIPDAYQHCELDCAQVELDQLSDSELKFLLDNPPNVIVNPEPAHLKAIQFFRMILSGDSLVCNEGNPLEPSVGAYLYGPPGVGKTHIMAAFGLEIHSRLQARLGDLKTAVGDLVERAYARYLYRESHESYTEDPDVGWVEAKDLTLHQSLSPRHEFWKSVHEFQQRLMEYRYQPTDVLYIGFKELYELCKFGSERDDAMNAIDNARIVFIDDIHPQGDMEQVQIVLHLLERRYEMGRAGTFLTTNLDTAGLGGGDEMLGKRLTSRCAETLLTFDFSGCRDWRTHMKSRRIKNIERELETRISSMGEITSLSDIDLVTGILVEEVDADKE
jgi:DNA replication protein DnaC